MMARHCQDTEGSAAGRAHQAARLGGFQRAFSIFRHRGQPEGPPSPEATLGFVGRGRHKRVLHGRVSRLTSFTTRWSQDRCSLRGQSAL